MLLTPSSCHKLSHLLGPPPLESDVLYGRPPSPRNRLSLLELIVCPAVKVFLNLAVALHVSATNLFIYALPLG